MPDIMENLNRDKRIDVQNCFSVNQSFNLGDNATIKPNYKSAVVQYIMNAQLPENKKAPITNIDIDRI